MVLTLSNLPPKHRTCSTSVFCPLEERLEWSATLSIRVGRALLNDQRRRRRLELPDESLRGDSKSRSRQTRRGLAALASHAAASWRSWSTCWDSQQTICTCNERIQDILCQPMWSSSARILATTQFPRCQAHAPAFVWSQTLAFTHSHATGVDRAPPQVFSSFHLEQQTLKRLVKAGATTVATLLDNGYLSSHVSLARHTLVRQSQSLGRITLDKNSSMVKPEEITAFMAGELSSVLDQAEEPSF